MSAQPHKISEDTNHGADLSETPLRIGIQGIAGCWHDMAARTAFPDRNIEIVEYEQFEDLFAGVEADPAQCAVVAFENTIAGALMGNHELLRQSSLCVTGEIRLRITHSLAVYPGQSLNDVKEISSHPMALHQCERFLNTLPGVRRTEHNDTAGAARDIFAERQLGKAAICSAYAARKYGLDIVADGIETDKHNFTRFLLLAHSPEPKLPVDKVSIVFTLPHTRGALSKILTILSFYDINLTKIQSWPIIGREWEYRFYVDLTFDSEERYSQAIDAVRPLMGEFKVLGKYMNRL